MIKYKCRNCGREKELEEKVVLILCICGYEMKEVNDEKEKAEK